MRKENTEKESVVSWQATEDGELGHMLLMGRPRRGRGVGEKRLLGLAMRSPSAPRQGQFRQSGGAVA